MSSSKTMGLTFLTISRCTPQPELEEVKLPPNHYVVPLFVVSPPKELGPDCEKEGVSCNYYSDYGTVFVFKCLNDKDRPRIYVSEMCFGEKLWYETRLKQDINNQTFSEYCKSTFDNYKWFMQALEKR